MNNEQSFSYKDVDLFFTERRVAPSFEQGELAEMYIKKGLDWKNTLPLFEEQIKRSDIAAVLQEGYLKIILFQDKTKERIKALITSAGGVSHSVHAVLFQDFLELEKEDFVGAGDIKEKEIRPIKFFSTTCEALYGKDRPESIEEQEAILQKTADALQALSQDILEESFIVEPKIERADNLEEVAEEAVIPSSFHRLRERLQTWIGGNKRS